MQVSVVQSGKLGRKMNVTVPATEIACREEKRLKKLGQKIKLDGFRKGKVPLSLVKQRYGARVRQEVLNDLLESSLVEALTQEKLRPTGMPTIENTQFEQGKSLMYTAVFEVYPEVKVKPFDKLKVARWSAEISDADIEKTLVEIRKQHRDWLEVTRAATKGDQVDINFVGSIDGEAFTGGMAENVKLELGVTNMIDGFAEGVVGMHAGEEKTTTVTFPKDYAEQQLAGKEAQFVIKINTVAEASLPEVDATFAARMGIKKGGVEALKTEIKKNMQRELTQIIITKNKQEVMNALFAANKIDLPQVAIDAEIERLQKQAEKAHPQQFANEAMKTKHRETFTKEATRRVALGLIIAAITEQQQIKLDTSRVRKMIEDIADAYENPVEVVNMYYQDKQRLAGVESLVLEQQVVEKVLQDAKVTERQSNFDELISIRTHAH